jgi:hypothetical protein
MAEKILSMSNRKIYPYSPSPEISLMSWGGDIEKSKTKTGEKQKVKKEERKSKNRS